MLFRNICEAQCSKRASTAARLAFRIGHGRVPAGDLLQVTASLSHVRVLVSLCSDRLAVASLAAAPVKSMPRVTNVPLKKVDPAVSPVRQLPTSGEHFYPGRGQLVL